MRASASRHARPAAVPAAPTKQGEVAQPHTQAAPQAAPRAHTQGTSQVAQAQQQQATAAQAPQQQATATQAPQQQAAATQAPQAAATQAPQQKAPSGTKRRVKQSGAQQVAAAPPPKLPEAFASTVDRYLAIDDELRGLSEKAKALKKEQAQLGEAIMGTMSAHGYRKCETGAANLSISVSVAQKSLTMGLISKAVADAFPNMPDLAARVAAAIKAARSKDAGQRTRLKRVKKRSPA